MKISVTTSSFDKFGFDIFYLLEIIKDEQLLLAGKAKTGMLCYDYSNKKIVFVSEEVKDKLSLQ